MENTALQQLLEYLEGFHEYCYDNKDCNSEFKKLKYQSKTDILEQIILKIKTNYINKEKLQITNAFCAAYSLSNGIKNGNRLAEQYYSCVFNPNSF